MTSHDSIRFFFGANTADGFVGFHQTDLYDARGGWAAYLIKSGAGTGKATFMRRVLHELTAKGLEAETIYCSSDPDSLDAVVFPTIKLCVIDATSPHIIEPTAYGECEQLVPFGCCLQSDKALAQSDDWFEAADACTAAHARSCRFLAAAGSLLENNRLLASGALNTAKLDSFLHRLLTRECPHNMAENGRETRRFLSAVTPKGYVFFGVTAAALCPKLYVLEDEYGAVSARFMSVLRERFSAAGQSVFTCFSPLTPQTPSHILVPTLGVGFLTSDSRDRVDFPVYRRIHAARFLDNEQLRDKKQQLRFNRRAASQMLDEAIQSVTSAKHHHDRMEELHIKAMDWDKWQAIADETMTDIHNVVRQRMC